MQGRQPNFTVHCDFAVLLKKRERMKTLDFAAMETVQGGASGNIMINLPLTSLLSTLGLGSSLGLGLGLGIGIAYQTDGLTGLGLPSLPSLGILGL